MWFFCRRRAGPPALPGEAPAALVVTSKTCLLHHAPITVDVDRITMANAHRCSELARDELERPERLAVLVGDKGVLRELDGVELREISGRTVNLREGVVSAIQRVHSAEYYREVWHAADEVTDKLMNFDERINSGGTDTKIGPHSYNAAIAGATAVLHATDEVMTGRVRSAFAAVRPPGHHVGHSGPVPDSEDSLGFCLFNNAATAAAYAAQHYGAAAAVVDFDVHQANGTQDCVESLALRHPDLDLAVFSVHARGEDVYPTTGQADSTEAPAFNFSMPMQTPAKEWKIKARRLLQALVAWLEDPARAGKAKLLVLSAGFDAHEADKSGLLTLEDTHFAWVTFMLRAVAERCSAKIVSMLEGGYTYLPASPPGASPLAASVHAHVAALSEGPVPRPYQAELTAVVTRKGLKSYELADAAPYVEDAGPDYCMSPTTGDRRSPRIKRSAKGKENSSPVQTAGKATSPKTTGTKSPKRKASGKIAS